MKLTIDPCETLDIEASSIYLRGGHPVVNSSALKDFQVEVVLHELDHQIVQYRSSMLGDAVFGLEICRDRPSPLAPLPEGEGGRFWLRYWIEGMPSSQELGSFGLQFQGIENLRAYLRNGYTSWDGSTYVDVEALADFGPHETRPELGYAMTQLLPRHGESSLVLGFDRHDRFQHTFTFDSLHCPPALKVLTLWDRKEHSGPARCESERLVIFESRQVENGLREWARITAQASSLPPRARREPITDWCSWYNLYAYISEEIILDHLKRVKKVSDREKLPLRVFQIDEGFIPEMGDWLEVKPQFSRGMKPLLDDIRQAGFIPGLWIGPFMVGNRSRLYRDHPDWVVRDRKSGGPLVQWRLVGEERWHKRSEEYYILDATHPEAFEYLRQVFHAWRHEWGCEYFKTDFMHFGSEHRPDRAVWHTPGSTRIEVWRKVAEMIRAEIGDALWLGCGCPLWASVGLVDAVRIGHDVGVDWRGRLSAQSLLNDLATRNFANHVLWQADPDCILLRDEHHNLTDQEVRSLAIYAGMSGGVLMTSDDLQELSGDRLRLWKFVLEMDSNACNFPFLGSSPLTYERVQASYPSSLIGHEARLVDPVIVQVRPRINSNSQSSAVFIFNTGEHPVQRSFPLESLRLNGPLHVFDWIRNQAYPKAVDCLSVNLDAHDSVILLLSENPCATE
ncbi:MAG: alpha-galactosidase [Anaerolineae bacterium]|nr:alpha-galactosidase [Anaerolineae bacterium]